MNSQLVSMPALLVSLVIAAVWVSSLYPFSASGWEGVTFIGAAIVAFFIALHDQARQVRTPTFLAFGAGIAVSGFVFGSVLFVNASWRKTTLNSESDATGWNLLEGPTTNVPIWRIAMILSSFLLLFFALVKWLEFRLGIALVFTLLGPLIYLRFGVSPSLGIGSYTQFSSQDIALIFSLAVVALSSLWASGLIRRWTFVLGVSVNLFSAVTLSPLVNLLGASLATILAAVFVVFLAKGDVLPRVWALVFSLLPILLAFSLVFVLPIRTTIGEMVNKGDSLSGRAPIWNSYLDLILEQPLAFNPPTEVDALLREPHSLYVQIVYRLGVPIGILLLGLFTVLIFVTARRCAKNLPPLVWVGFFGIGGSVYLDLTSTTGLVIWLFIWQALRGIVVTIRNRPPQKTLQDQAERF